MSAPHIFEQEQWVPQPLEKIFAFFSDARNLEPLTPPWLKFHILTSEPIAMVSGARIDYRLSWHGIPLHWKTEIAQWEPPYGFEDVQFRGPYRLWRHTHRFEPISNGTRILDNVLYSLPFGPLGRLIQELTVRRNIEKIFEYRKEKIRALFGD